MIDTREPDNNCPRCGAPAEHEKHVELRESAEELAHNLRSALQNMEQRAERTERERDEALLKLAALTRDRYPEAYMLEMGRLRTEKAGLQGVVSRYEAALREILDASLREDMTGFTEAMDIAREALEVENE